MELLVSLLLEIIKNSKFVASGLRKKKYTLVFSCTDWNTIKMNAVNFEAILAYRIFIVFLSE